MCVGFLWSVLLSRGACACGYACAYAYARVCVCDFVVCLFVTCMCVAPCRQDNNDALARLVEVFSRMGQLKFVCVSFAKARVSPLLELWRDSYDTHTNFVDWLGECLCVVCV